MHNNYGFLPTRRSKKTKSGTQMNFSSSAFVMNRIADDMTDFVSCACNPYKRQKTGKEQIRYIALGFRVSKNTKIVFKNEFTE